jgi:hypothetical protein
MTSDEILVYLINYCNDRGWHLMITDQLSPYTPSTSNSATKSIMVNSNFHIKRQVPYQFAHEIHHVEAGDSNILYFSLQKAGIEGAANRAAVKMLVPLYFDGVEPELARVDNFMEAFAIPGNMRDWCEHDISDFYART